MGTEVINQAYINKFEIIKNATQIVYRGGGELSLKRGAYGRNDAFIAFGTQSPRNFQEGNIENVYSIMAFAYFSYDELEVLRDKITDLLEDQIGEPIESFTPRTEPTMQDLDDLPDPEAYN